MKYLLILLIFLTIVGPANASLVSQWLLAGDFTDEQGANNGAGVNTPTFGEGPAGEANTAMVLDGTDQYAEITYDATLDNPAAYTWTCWAKSTQTGSAYGDRARIVDMGGFAGAGYGIYLEDTDNLIHGYNDGNVSQVCDDTLDTDWHFYAITFNAAGDSKLFLYRDGSLQGTGASISTDVINDNPIRFGARSEDVVTNFWKGSIADVRFYNTSLSASEIEAIRQEMLGGTSGGIRDRYESGYRSNYRSRYN